MTILLGAVAIIILLLFLLGLGLYIYISKPKLTSLEEAERIERDKGFWEDFDEYPKDVLNITCRDGYLIHGTFLPQEGKKFAIITHGYTYNRCGSVKYANIFYKLGYNVYIYDLRHHGENKRCFCSMGYYESQDITDIIAYFRRNYGEDIIIGLHGESLGAASSIMATGRDSSIDFLVEDCGFADLDSLTKYLCKRLFHLPGILTHVGSWISYIHRGIRYDRICPLHVLLKNDRTPILFIHGKDDTFIPMEHGMRLYESYRGPKELALFDGADHAESFSSDRDRYRDVVREFLNKQVDEGRER